MSANPLDPLGSSTDSAKAAEILRLIDSAHNIVNHTDVSKLDHTAWLQSRDALWRAHTGMEEAIRDSAKYGDSPIDHAYANDVPTTLLFVRDHPGVRGKEATEVISRVYRARALFGTYPEGYELHKQLRRE